ncbi:AraC family ligand binding domain-containing protein (plasmid) [Deinococcus sp. KNUC1210]|uniref:AraC family ligand binding domain-containing protein n=1 Tax=Deinococcus sp. KNUC1210 TaxID=2917691 RepID=UPI001EF1552D|nr:AraC family ligand binding domain-containing protein [Deinococcus sp. KNUC1210]ULH18017.1 AraC family ligand binding domain-containing protein [Deinococcus sp. KNUC1210]
MADRRQESPQPPFPPFLNVAPNYEVKTRGYYAWREHGTNDWLLKFTISGRGRVGSVAGDFTLEAGNCILFRPGTPHDYGTHPAFRHWEIAWAHFRPRPEWLELLNWPEIAPGLLQLNLANKAARRQIAYELKQVNTYARGNLPNREAFAMNALERALLLLNAENSRATAYSLDPRIEIVLTQLRAYPAAHHTREQLAVLSGLSVSRFSHLFQAQVSQSPQEFIEFLRIDRAKNLLETTPVPFRVSLPRWGSRTLCTSAAALSCAPV